MYGLEGRMTMLPNTDSNFVSVPPSTSAAINVTAVTTTASISNQNNIRANSPHIGISKRHSTDVEKALKINHHPPLVSTTSEKGTSSTDHRNVIEGSPSSSVFNGGGDSRQLAMEYRRSSGASRLTSSQDSSDLAGSLKRFTFDLLLFLSLFVCSFYYHHHRFIYHT